MAMINAFGRQYMNRLTIEENGALASCLLNGLITKASLKFETAGSTVAFASI